MRVRFLSWVGWACDLKFSFFLRNFLFWLFYFLLWEWYFMGWLKRIGKIRIKIVIFTLMTLSFFYYLFFEITSISFIFTFFLQYHRLFILIWSRSLILMRIFSILFFSNLVHKWWIFIFIIVTEHFLLYSLFKHQFSLLFVLCVMSC